MFKNLIRAMLVELGIRKPQAQVTQDFMDTVPCPYKIEQPPCCYEGRCIGGGCCKRCES